MPLTDQTVLMAVKRIRISLGPYPEIALKEA